MNIATANEFRRIEIKLRTLSYSIALIQFVKDKNEAKVTELLMVEGIDINFSMRPCGRTALIEAVCNNSLPIVHLLLPHSNINKTSSSFGNTALIYACQKGYDTIVLAL